jgi:outer membrane receptor protein involved in Fe transport
VVLGGQWTQELGNGSQLIARSTFHYESETDIVEGLAGFLPDGQDAAVAAAAQFTRQVDDLSASLTYVFADTDLELSIWGRNLLDDRYLQSIFDSVGQPRAISGYTNQPRTYGATARYRF